MSASETHFLSGKAMYARVFENNRDMEGYEGAYRAHEGMYEVMLGVPTDGDDHKLIMSWNKMYEPKHLGDKGFEAERGAVEGVSYFRFKRKHKHVIGSGKEIPEWGGQPKIVMKDGKTPWDTSVLIGNGSDLTLKLNVFTMSRLASIVRLEGIRVDNLVEAPEREKTEEDQTSAAGGDSADDIPF